MTGDGRALPGRLAAEIGRQLDCLELVLRHLAEVEAVRDARAAQAREEGGSKLAALLRLKGIGPELATVLELEVFHRTSGPPRRGGLCGPGTQSLCQRRHEP